MQDVFKVAYSSDGGENGKGKANALDSSSSETPEHSTPLKHILSYINAQFAEFDPSSSYRQPHFKVCRHFCQLYVP